MSTCEIPGCEEKAQRHMRVCHTHRGSQPSGMRPKGLQERHPCPVPGCSETTATEHLMCFNHWQKLPQKQKITLYRAWNNGQPLPGYNGVIREAIEVVKGKETAKK